MPLPASPSDVTRFRRLDAVSRPAGTVVPATKRPTASSVPVTPVTSRIATAVVRASNVTAQIAPRTTLIAQANVNSGRGKK